MSVQNILDERIPEERLPKPLSSKKPIRSKKPKPLPRENPFPVRKPREKTDYRQLLRWLNVAPVKEGREGTEERGRRFIRWRISKKLEEDLTDSFMNKIRERVGTSFYMRHNYSYWLRNIGDGTIILYFKNSGGSPWITHLSDAEVWFK